ncbi:MAG: hypothetical protein Kow00117_11130 [Phototrophicales bacterium]
MKQDIDRLMQERELTAILIPADHNYSPALDYLVGHVHITGGFALKKIGEAPVLIVGIMEIEEAAATGLTVYSDNQFGWAEIRASDCENPTAEFWATCLKQLGVEAGKIGIYGVGELNLLLAIQQYMAQNHPQYQLIGEKAPTLFDLAAMTKDADEITRIRSVAERTVSVQQATWDFIQQHQADATETVIKADGSPLTIGDVRRFILIQLMERGLEDTGMIFAQGRDAGFPHSRGQDHMPLKLGEPIVFDLFPRERGGGYHHDTTRTWCIGYAPPEVQKIYDDVMTAFEVSLEAYGLNKPTHLMQEAVLNYFESQGHPTSRNDPQTTVGYIHSLGHGVGLKIHEAPRITHLSKEDTFQVGQVITIEPGLYYPEQGIGVRIEDTFYISEDGSLISLTPFRKDLILPLF